MRTSLLLSSILLLTAACATQKSDPFIDKAAQLPTESLLESSEWGVISGHTFSQYNIKSPLKDLQLENGKHLTVQFSNDHRLSITGGCNTLSGTWNLQGNQLTVSSLTSTRMACEKKRMALEDTAKNLFSKQTLTVLVLPGLGESLLRLNTSHYYFTLQSSAKSAESNRSYTGESLLPIK